MRAKAQIGGCLEPLGPWVENDEQNRELDQYIYIYISSLSMAIRK